MNSFIPFLIQEEIYVSSNFNNQIPNVEWTKNENKITKLLLVHPTLTQEEQDLMQNIIKAIGFNLANMNSLTLTPEDNIKFTILQEKIGFQQLMSFGVSPKQLGLNIIAPLYHPLFINNTEILFSENLTELTKKDKKKRLWQSLKQMFNL